MLGSNGPHTKHIDIMETHNKKGNTGKVKSVCVVSVNDTNKKVQKGERKMNNLKFVFLTLSKLAIKSISHLKRANKKRGVTKGNFVFGFECVLVMLE